MQIEERQLRVHDLHVGMFVCRLDRPWIETPFPLQGFRITDLGQIEHLAKLCESVWIDVEKSRNPEPALELLTLGKGFSPASALGARERRWLGATQYPQRTTVEEELPRATEARQTVSTRASEILGTLRSGRSVSHEQITEAVEPVVASLVRNPDAFFWLEVLRKRDNYAYDHAINCCALATGFGRYLGFPEEVLHDLATGGMLLDIGILQVPTDVLQRQGTLTAEEMQFVHRHVADGLDIYDEMGFGNEDVRIMLLTHHERCDGSGYPAGIKMRHIPLLGRIAGIVDSFDAMICARPYRPALSRAAALQELYRERGRLYQSELVEQFVQCLGVYPVGSLVELNTGEVGVVMGQNPTRRLRPKLMLLTDPDKQLRAHFQSLDLLSTRQGDAPGADVHIARSLDPGAYGLEPTELYL